MTVQAGNPAGGQHVLAITGSCWRGQGHQATSCPIGRRAQICRACERQRDWMGPQDHTSPNSSLGSATPQAHQREAHISLIRWARTHSMSMKTWIKTTQIVLSRKQGLSLCKLEAERQGMLRQLEDVHQGLSQLLETRHLCLSRTIHKRCPQTLKSSTPAWAAAVSPRWTPRQKCAGLQQAPPRRKKKQEQAS